MLVGEGMTRMTPERLRILGDMVSGLGLRIAETADVTRIGDTPATSMQAEELEEAPTCDQGQPLTDSNDEPTPADPNVYLIALEFVTDLMRTRAKERGEGKLAAEDPHGYDAKMGRLAELPKTNLPLAQHVYTILSKGDETRQLLAAYSIGELAEVDWETAGPIWRELLDPDSPAREEAWQTFIDDAPKDRIRLSQAIGLIRRYTEEYSENTD
jgi:hypothetical protein